MKNLNRVNTWLGALLMFCVFCENAYGQKNKFSITAEIISVERNAFPKSKCKNIPPNDTMPIRINIEFIVKNETRKKMLFSSNTKNYYRNQEYLYYSDSNYGIIGRFLMINKCDTIVLFTDKYNLVPTSQDDIVIWGTVDYFEKDSTFNDLLCRFTQSGQNYKEEIYSYLKECQFIYIPVVSDYERKLAELDDKETKGIVFPQKIIAVKKKAPFLVEFLTEDELDGEIYPPIKKKESLRLNGSNSCKD